MVMHVVSQAQEEVVCAPDGFVFGYRYYRARGKLAKAVRPEIKARFPRHRLGVAQAPDAVFDVRLLKVRSPTVFRVAVALKAHEFVEMLAFPREAKGVEAL